MKNFSFYSPPENGEKSPVYEGLDTMRVFASFGVVLLHTCAATGTPRSLELFLKFREFALPALVMTSFFLLTVSLVRDPEMDFGRFFARRVARLWVPFFIWTLFYVLMTHFLIPVVLLQPPENFSPIVFLTGFRHLWYLQFIFIGSLAVFPLLSRTLRFFRTSAVKPVLLCLSGAVFYWIFYFFGLGRSGSWQSFNAEADLNLQIFALQTSQYLFYVPLAIGLGLIGDRIEKVFRHAIFRKISLVAVLVALALHLGNAPFAATREIYGAAVFVAILQPWKKIPFRFGRQLVAYSYGIYILHFLGAQILGLLLFKLNWTPGGPAILFFSLVIYFSSFAAAVVLRKIFPFDWLLPLVRVQPESPERFSILRLALAGDKFRT